MTIFNAACLTKRDYAQYCRFIVKHREELGMTAEQILNMLLIQLRYGQLCIGVAKDGEIESVFCFFIGTPEEDFEDTHIALIDLVLIKKEKRTTLSFLRVLRVLQTTIVTEYPQVRELRVLADADNTYNNRLYSKFMKQVGTAHIRDRLANVYRVTMQDVVTYMTRFR